MANDGVELVFDPIFGVRSKKKLKEDAEDLGEESGKKFGSGFKKGTSSFGGAFKAMRSSASKAGNVVAGSFKSVFGSISGEVATIGASIGAAFAAKGLIQATAQIEQMSVKMKTLTGSTAKAKDIMTDLRAFAAKTPFQLTGIVDASSKLIAFGKSVQGTKIAIREIGDVAAGTGTPIGNLATIYGQVGAAGKLTGERLLQFQERAVPIGPAIAKTMGVAESSVRNLVSQGKVTSDIFEKAFRSMTTEGGMFAGAMLAQSRTLSGVFSTFKDTIFDLQATMGEKFGPVVVATMTEVIKIVGKFTENLKKNGVQAMKDFAQTAIESATVFNDLFIPVIMFVVRTFGLLKSAVVVAIQGVIGAFAKLASAGAQVIQFFGGEGEITNAIIGFSETTGAVFNKMALDVGDKFGSMFDPMPIQGRIATVIENIRNGVASIINETGKLEGAAKKVAANTTKTLAKVSMDVSGTIASGVTGAVQGIVAAAQSGENVMEAVGKGMLGIVADLATQLGQFMILAGIGKQAVEFLPGGAAIAAGVALVAFGALLSSFTGGSPAAGGASSGGGVSAGVASNAETSSLVDEPEERTTETGINVNIAGDFLDSEEGGLKIVQAINNAFETQGAVIRTGVA